MKGFYKKSFSYMMMLIMCIGNVSNVAAYEGDANAGIPLVTPGITLKPNTKYGGGGIIYKITDTENNPAYVTEYNITVYEKSGETYVEIGDFNTEGSDYVTLNDGENLVAGQKYVFTVTALAKKRTQYAESEESAYSNEVIAAGYSDKGTVVENSEVVSAAENLDDADIPFVSSDSTSPPAADNNDGSIKHSSTDTVNDSNHVSSDSVKIKVDGKELSDAQAILKNGSTLLPVRSVGNALGGEIIWDAVAQTVIITKDNTKVVMPVGGKYIIVDSDVVNISTPAQIINGRTYVPLRVLGDALDCDIEWINATKTVEISDKKISGNRDLFSETKKDIPYFLSEGIYLTAGETVPVPVVGGNWVHWSNDNIKIEWGF